MISFLEKKVKWKKSQTALEMFGCLCLGNDQHFGKPPSWWFYHREPNAASGIMLILTLCNLEKKKQFFFFFISNLSIVRDIVKAVIYAGGKLRIFCSQTIRVGIKFAFAWFNHSKVFLFL